MVLFFLRYVHGKRSESSEQATCASRRQSGISRDSAAKGSVFFFTTPQPTRREEVKKYKSEGTAVRETSGRYVALSLFFFISPQQLWLYLPERDVCISILHSSGLEALGPVAPRARQRGPAKLPRGTCTHTRATSIMHQLFFPGMPTHTPCDHATGTRLIKT